MIFRFINFAGNEGTVVMPDHSDQLASLPTYEIDSFSLNTGYRDPFLGGVYKKKSRTHYNSFPKVTSVIKKEDKKIEPSVPFPHVNYGGNFFNSTLEKDIHILEIEGTYHHVSRVGQYGKVEVSQIFKDSIEIKFNNEVKILHH